MKLDKNYWAERYQTQQTGWDIGYPAPALVEYITQIEEKTIKILIPGAGNAYEAAYLYRQGYTNIYILDFVPKVLEGFMQKIPDFPKEQVIVKDFFNYTNTFDIILEQTFFCAIPKEKRERYCLQVQKLLKPQGKIVGVLFASEFEKPGPPFGGVKEDYQKLFSNFFNISTLAPCYNSIPPRQGNELFFIFENN
ncbi:methyltransferase domain-containing protein [Aquimarina brevivitae]|uniref:Thiopurine S-methyltransferase n=1 Tax=Aquimarina brevivitae TaxID=323412 RepID=A0A4Q7P0L2_9FLAO|nr:methyltransferase domain-containing protein [Aquimarina brevivitae]RZS93215.1 thiopurine S-methyltransferase [Aquimarina brevivitae]